MMQQFVQLGMNALAAGCIYAVIALSFELAYESTGVVNFATGQLVTIGALVGASAATLPAIGLGGAYALTMGAMALVALVFLVAVYLPLRSQPVLTVVIGTVGAGIFIQNIALLTWGPLPRAMPSPMGRQTASLLGASVSYHVFYVIGVSVVLILGLYLLLYRSPLGSQLRALAQDAETARLMGIRVSVLYVVTWIMVCCLAGIAGLLVGPMWFIDVTTGDNLGLKAFAAAIIGGFGSIPGAIIGGVLVGFTEIFGASFISSAYKDAIVFGLMFLFLLVRPQGLFGERIAERG
jgi:branched-chain amino acid transport system permease protein